MEQTLPGLSMTGVFAMSQSHIDIDTDKRRDMVEDARYAFENAPKLPINISETERWLSGAGGLGLILYGLKTRGPMGLALGAIGAALACRGVTGHSCTYKAMGFSTADHDRSHAAVDGSRSLKIEESIFIAADHVTLYRFWRNPENLSRVMTHVKSVRNTSNNRSRWVVEGPMGTDIEWDAEIFNDRENELIAWRSLEGSEVSNAGSVRFKKDDSGAGTTVKVSLMYYPPAGKLGAAIAKLMGDDPARQVREDLERFKTIAEAGSINNAALNA